MTAEPKPNPSLYERPSFARQVPRATGALSNLVTVGPRVSGGGSDQDQPR